IRYYQEATADKEIPHCKEAAAQLIRMQAWVTRLLECWESLRDHDTIAGYTQKVSAIVAEFIPDSPNCQKIMEALGTPGSLVLRRRQTSRLTAGGVGSNETFDPTLISGDSALSLPFEHYREILYTLLDNVRLDRGEYGSEGIIICSRMPARGVSFDVLFIPGMNQGAVPLREKRDILLDESRRREICRQKGLDPRFLSTGESRSQEEKLLFALILDSARRRLILSYSTWDDQRGAALLPSWFLLELGRVVEGRIISAEEIPELSWFDQNIPPSVDPDEMTKFLTRRSVSPSEYPQRWIEAFYPPEVRHHYLNLLPDSADPVIERGRQYRQARSRSHWTAWDGLFDEKWAEANLRRDSYDVTELEHYAACPFKYYFTHLLGAKPIEEPESLLQIPSHATGLIIHAVLRDFMREATTGHSPLRTEDVAWSRETIQELVRSQLQRAQARWPAPAMVWDLTRETLQSRLKRFVAELCRQNDEFKFHKAEQMIQTTFSLPLEDSSVEVILKGRIDRIDLSPDGKRLRIIDYKTGKKPKDPGDLKNGTQIQLPLYLQMALKDHPEISSLDAVAAFYHLSPEGELNILSGAGEELTALKPELDETISRLIQGIRSGVFVPTPVDLSECKDCPAQWACDPKSRAKAGVLSHTNVQSNVSFDCRQYGVKRDI
ncbi:MAG: PD-(D/E)XK nuclease family protein, partial [Calditrichota bacterium]